ncbi:hypothetical protein M758_10G021500 [Ceratodon purpureus]|nr:hypothetical protein M758_10G021500 [Ceratodon purpureus]
MVIRSDFLGIFVVMGQILSSSSHHTQTPFCCCDVLYTQTGFRQSTGTHSETTTLSRNKSQKRCILHHDGGVAAQMLPIQYCLGTFLSCKALIRPAIMPAFCFN